MELYVMNPSYEQIGIIDGFKSLIWTKKYFEFGDCEVYISATKNNFDLLKIGNFLIRNDDDMVCRIDDVKTDTNTEKGDFIIAIGTDCRCILNQRIVWRQTNFKGRVGSFIGRIIDENIISPSDSARKIPEFIRRSLTSFDDTIDIQTTFDKIGDKIIEVCKMFGIGSKVTFRNGLFTFDLYKGMDRSYGQDVNPYVIFSSDFENIISTEYEVDNTNSYSIAMIAGAGEGNNRLRTTTALSKYTGIKRYEMYVDAKDISNEISYDDLIELYPGGNIRDFYYFYEGVKIATLDSDTEPQNATLENKPYFEMLAERGKEKLSETGTVIKFDGEVEPNQSFIFGQDYFLGDIVTVRNDYGIEADARITEVIESFDSSGHKVIPTFEYIEVKTDGN